MRASTLIQRRWQLLIQTTKIGRHEMETSQQGVNRQVRYGAYKVASQSDALVPSTKV